MQQTDLYSLLWAYAVKVKTSLINIKKFLEFVSKFAAQKKSDFGWAPWAGNAVTQFNNEINALVDSGKCVLLLGNKDGHVFMADYCRQRIKDAYVLTDKLGGAPFPNEENLNLKIPNSYVRSINLATDIGLFLEQPDNSNSEDIIIMHFPHNYGSALVTTSMIPSRLLMVSLAKIQHFLYEANKKEYIINRLKVQMESREKAFREIVDRIRTRPMDCLDEMKRFDDTAFLFWLHFFAQIKMDIKDKDEIHSEDLAVVQALSIIDICCNMYRSAAIKKREIENAFKTLESLMDNPPYHFTLNEIAEFINDKKTPLLEIYSRQELEAYIRTVTTARKDSELPSWLTINMVISGRWYLKKEHYLNICIRMLNNTQLSVKDMLIKRWTKLILDYSNEPAMEKDIDFEKLLKRLTGIISPNLRTILEDPKLYWAYEELEREQGAVPQPLRIFTRGMLLPYYSLYLLRRKDLISEIKSGLPIWYSNPFLVAILRFIKNFGKKKIVKNETDEDEEIGNYDKDHNKLQKSACQVQSAMVPQGKKPDDYLNELELRWGSLRDEKTRLNMVTGIQSLVRDHLRQFSKNKQRKISREDLREMSTKLATINPALAHLKDQEALRLYMELYALKLLINRRT
jgi:hypothetical protein